jgi:signal transduction histidine kinase
MIEDVLDLAKIKHKKFHLQIELFDIHKSINEVIEMLSEQSVLKGIDLAAIIHENVPQMVSTDPNRLKRVFINLIDNALKFTSRGHIHLKVNSSKPY